MSVPWTARRPNQSILKEINPESSLGRPMLKLKLQYFGYPMQRADSLEKTLILGEIESRRRRGRQRMRWLDDIIDSMDISLSKFQKIVKDGEAWHAAVHGFASSRYDRVTEQQKMSSCPSDSVSLEGALWMRSSPWWEALQYVC